LEFFKIILGGEFGTEFFSGWVLIGDIMSSPSPSIVAGLHLFQFAENILGDDVVIDNTFMSLICSDQSSDIS